MKSPAHYTLALLVALSVSACGSGADSTDVGSDPGAPAPAPGQSPTPPPAPAQPTASIDPLATLNRSQTLGYEFTGGMSEDADHIYASLYDASTNVRLQQWQSPVFNQTDRTRWTIRSSNELVSGNYRLEVMSGRGSDLSTLQAAEFDVVDDVPAPSNLLVEGGGETIRLIDAYDGVTISGITDANAQIGIDFVNGKETTTLQVTDADSNGDFSLIFPREELPRDGNHVLRVRRIVPEAFSNAAEIPVTVTVDPIRTVMSCESGTRGGRYNFTKPSFGEETQWIDLAPNGDVLRNGLTSGDRNNLSAIGTITNLNDGFYRWSYDVSTMPRSGTNYNVVYALDGSVRASGNSGYAPVGLVVTAYTTCIPAGDRTGVVPAAPTIDPISEDDHLDEMERNQSISISGQGTPNSVVTVRTTFGYTESARVSPQGVWSIVIFNLTGQELEGVWGTHIVTAFVRFNEQNSTIASRGISIGELRGLP